MKGNFKAKCTYSIGRDCFTEGEVYEVKNGVITFNNGNKSSDGIDNIVMLNTRMTSKFVPVNEKSQSIHIYRHDNGVIATLKSGKKTVKTAKAKCNPSDEFELEIGAKLALARLFNPGVKYIEIETVKAVKEVHRPANVGEWIKVTGSSSWHGKKYSTGELYLIDHEASTNKYWHYDKPDELCFDTCEYVVLENYQPEKKEKTLSDYSTDELLTEIKRRIKK